MDTKIKVMLLMEEGYIKDSVKVILSITDDIVLVGEADNIDASLEIMNSFEPDVIILGEEVNGKDGFLISERIMEENPFQPIILIASQQNVDTYKKALRVGVREVLKTPLYPNELKRAIIRVHDTKGKVGHSLYYHDISATSEEEQKPEGENEIEDKNNAQVISIFSIKGGVGKTTISTNLAVALAESGKKTALLDLDIYSGDIALAMNVIPKRRVADLANDISRLDLDLLASYMVKHFSGVMVFTAPFSIEHADYIKPEHIEKILSLLKQEYDYIVIDCPNYFYDIAMVALDHSDMILLVATMDILSLKSIKSTIKVLENLKVDKTKLNLVVNKYIKGVGLTLNDVEVTLAMPVTTAIPLESQPVISSMNQGIPFVTSMKRSKVAKAVQDLVKEILARAGDGE